MMNHITYRVLLSATFLTVLSPSFGLVTEAKAASAVGRSATVKNTPAKPVSQPVSQTSAAPTGVAPPEKVDTLKLSTSDSDEAGTLPERIDVQSMKRRYWTVGNEDLMDVVQNRLYTKKGRLEAGLRYGFWSDDPFQTQKTTALSLGYHVNEFISVHGFYGAISASNSGAYTDAQAALRLAGTSLLDPVVNPGKSVMGIEARGSLIYGKLSILGKSIAYYDLNVALGLSQHKATVGSSTGYFGGFGQQFYLNRTVFVTVDYRILFHTDAFNAPPKTSRALTTNWIQLGVGVFAF